MSTIYMNTIKRAIVIAPLALLALFSSCNQWLTLQPEDGVIKDNYWSTKEEVLASTIGCYSSILTTGMDLRMYLWGELRGETLMPNLLTSANGQAVQAIMDGDIVPTNTLCSWDQFYKVVNQCNTVIDFGPDVLKTDESFTPAKLASYQAEAVAIRSLMYFYLVRTFGDVPYQTTAIVSDDQDLQIPKISGAIILDSLIQDLEAAATALPTSYGLDAAENKGRFTAYGAYALLADMYLWKEDYANCISNCNKIINSGKISLLYADNSLMRYQKETDNALTGEKDTVYYAYESSISDFYNRMYVLGNCEESIFELQREVDFPNYDYWTLFQPSGYLYANTTAIRELYFLPSEVDRGVIDIRGEGVSFKGSFVWKHLGLTRDGAALSTLRTRATMTSNPIIYRLAEIYLFKAEALVQQAKVLQAAGDTTGTMYQTLNEAWDLVKAIRDRSNATETTDLCATVTKITELDCTTMDKFVYEERIREMMYEGKRWFDALRFAKRDNYGGPGSPNLVYLNDMAIYGASAAKVTSLQTKLKNHDFHYLPIAQDELDANKALEQNPFYK